MPGLIRITTVPESLQFLLKGQMKFMQQHENAVDIVKHVNLEALNGAKRVLMHSCCAPCAGELMEQMIANGIELTIFFYNPNIHPLKEYEIRKQENIRFAENLTPTRIDVDAEGFATRIHMKDADGAEHALPARAILVAAGTRPNTVLAREDAEHFALDGQYFRALDEAGDVERRVGGDDRANAGGGALQDAAARAGAGAATGTGVDGTLGFSTVGSGLDGSGASFVLIGSA